MNNVICKNVLRAVNCLLLVTMFDLLKETLVLRVSAAKNYNYLT